MTMHNYYDVEFEVRPLDGWPRTETVDRRRSAFMSTWSATVDVLAREVANLGADSAILQADITDYDRRKDGWIRATARPATSRVALTLDSDRGQLTFHCDKFDAWQDNVRAIALGLEALRKVDRYGITDTNEQYRGFGALPAGSGPISKDAAREILLRAAGIDGPGVSELADGASDLNLKMAYRSALKKTHPDKGGVRDEFDLVQDAARLLGIS